MLTEAVIMPGSTIAVLGFDGMQSYKARLVYIYKNKAWVKYLDVSGEAIIDLARISLWEGTERCPACHREAIKE